MKIEQKLIDFQIKVAKTVVQVLNVKPNKSLFFI